MEMMNEPIYSPNEREMNTSIVHILVVDDEPDLEFLVKQKFRKQIKAGYYSFTFALNGIDALKLLSENDSIQLIMTDINMPEMDGLTLLNEIKKLPQPCKTIVVSAYGDTINLRTAMNRGAFDFVTKPIDFTDLETTLEKTIEEQRLIIEGLKAKEELTTAVIEREQALESSRFKQQFLANMSHEIRTPLNAIVGMTNLLLSNNPREDQHRYLSAMTQASSNLLGIINDILDISKIEAGKIVLEQIDFNFQKVIDGVYQTLHLIAEGKKINFSYSINEKIVTWLKGDPTRLSQILINLTGNAIKFTPENGTVKIECDLLNSENGLETMQFKIIDSGIGISDEQKDKIFESFTQASSDTTRKFGGTGLGLSISKQLVDLQNGNIHVESELGKGTTFVVVLPFKIGEEKEEIQGIIASTDFGDRQLTILLAEDQPMNQMVAVDTIESLFPGVIVDVAENGKLAVEMAAEKKYDLIFMDIHMPIMDGYEATRQIKSCNGMSGSTPVIALTANVVKEEIDKCLEVGMIRHLAKPFSPEQLKSVIYDFA